MTARDRQTLEPLLRLVASRTGSCPESWQQLIRFGVIDHEPADLFGDPYGIDRTTCAIVAYKKFKDQ